MFWCQPNQKNFKQSPSSKLCICSLCSFPLHHLDQRKMFLDVSLPGLDPGSALRKVWTNVTLLVWADMCLPALEHCSSKGHYSSKLESSSFQFLWNARIDTYCTSFTSQEGEGSMSCKAFSSTVGAVFMACINLPMTIASLLQVGKAEWKTRTGEHVNANRLRTTGEGTQQSREMNSLTFFYQCQQLWGEFHTIADESIIERYCIMQETC